VRAGRGAGRADASDDLVLIDARAFSNARAERREVQVVGLETAVVADADLIAAAARPAGRQTVPDATATTAAP
jgi:hypothetical protein